MNHWEQTIFRYSGRCNTLPIHFQMSPLIVASLLLAVAWTAASDPSITDTCSFDGPWSSLLVQWATSEHSRQGRILSLPPTNGYYVTDRIDRPSLPPPRSPYDEWPANTPPPPPGKIVNRPPHKDKIKPSYVSSKFSIIK